MNIYLLSQSENIGYDSYDCVVVCAESEEVAKRTKPDTENHPDSFYDCTWTIDLSKINVKLLGIADESIKRGLICSAFHDG